MYGRYICGIRKIDNIIIYSKWVKHESTLVFYNLGVEGISQASCSEIMLDTDIKKEVIFYRISSPVNVI